VKIIETKQDNISIFKLNGRLDSNTSPEFENKIFEAIQSGSRSMIIDFKALDYISSAGLRVILKAAKELKRSGGRILLCSMESYIKEVFEVAGFDSFIPIVSTLDEAVNHF
jgi:anti-sigma B factor antagonist